MVPYYDDGQIQIWNADCRDVLPLLPPVDLVLTDPPYPDYYVDLYEQTPITMFADIDCRQLIFWSARCEFPLDYSAIHIWDKLVGTGCQYERIYERQGSTAYKVYRNYRINSSLSALWQGDAYNGHPSQKPIRLLRKLIQESSEPADLILDPFMGSGTTLRATKDCGRRAIGIELDERFCEIAVRRLQQSVLPLEIPA